MKEGKIIRYKEKYKTGMIFKSKEYPQFDFIIDYLTYYRVAEDADTFNLFSIVCWKRINEVEFDKFVCIKKGYEYIPDENGRMDFSNKTTFPYPFYGEVKPKSMDNYIKKYNFEYAGMSDKEIIIYQDSDDEYSSGFLKG